MNYLRNYALCVSLIIASAALVCAQDAPAPSHPHHAAKGAITRQQISDKLDQLQQAITAQQQQIQQLQQQVQTRDEVIQNLRQQSEQAQATAAAAQQKADTALAQAPRQQQSDESVRADIAVLKTHATDTTVTLQATQKRMGDLEHPLALHYKGVAITPVGFLAAETVWRQHGLGADINTPFNSIPFDGASQSSLSEFFGSGRQSRVGMLAEGKLDNAKLTGYMEGDFLSSGATSNNNQSNSYTARRATAAAFTTPLTERIPSMKLPTL
jgi:hypothetical protein